MKGCRQVRGMLTASFYETLPPDEARILNQHLAACPACRAESVALRRLTADIPTDTPVYEGDLLPALR